MAATTTSRVTVADETQPDFTSLSQRYGQVRGTTEALAAPLSAEDQTVQSMPDVSPTKWHRAHTTWFFETFILQPHVGGYHDFHPRYGYLFNSYYEAAGARHPRAQRGLLSRPGIEEIAAYRGHVDAAMEQLLAADVPPDVADLTELGLHHEQQHQELLVMDVKHVLALNPLLPAYRPPPGTRRPGAGDAAHPNGARGWIEHEGGLAEIGRDAAGAGFGFDNES